MVGLVDCDNFFCSCERVFRPDLARTPIVVLSNNDGCVVARSREAKAMGVPEGLPYYQLRKQYPDAGIVAFSSNYALYADMSARVMSVLREEAPDVAQYSIDEAFLDLDGVPSSDLKTWGERLCARVMKCTGMPVSLGIAPSRTLAKLASKFAKKYPGYNKSCLIGNDSQRIMALRLTPINDVWSIGRRITRSLETYGIRTALDFAMQRRDWVRHHYHVTGERTWVELNGGNVIDICTLDSVAKKTIVTSRSFPGLLTSVDDLRPHVANYAARCALKLRKQKSACRRLSVFVQSNHFRADLPQYDGGATTAFLTPTNTTSELVAAAIAVLESIYRAGISYKRAGIMVSDLVPVEQIQPDLFSFDPERRRKYNCVSSTLDAINRRMGADTLMLGAQQYPDRDPDGKSVRFVNAIRRAMKSPEYTTRLGAFTVS